MDNGSGFREDKSVFRNGRSGFREDRSGLGNISLVLIPLGVGSKSAEVINSSALAAPETLKTSAPEVDLRCPSPSLTAPFPFPKSPMKAGDTKPL